LPPPYIGYPEQIEKKENQEFSRKSATKEHRELKDSTGSLFVLSAILCDTFAASPAIASSSFEFECRR
jgi:hypothetical protein